VDHAPRMPGRVLGRAKVLAGHPTAAKPKPYCKLQYIHYALLA
jgi:hypothetical protein